jgi:hypothetical protein
VSEHRDDRLVPPPVEGLSDITWQRVEKNLFATLDCDASGPVALPRPARRWAPWAIGGGFALATAAAALLALMLRDPAPAKTAGVHDAGHPATSRVVTLDAPSEISFGDAVITVDPDSALTLPGDRDRGVVVMLERGGAMFEVAPRGGRPPFEVHAGEATVRVIGTRFEVQRSGDAARVDVIEGLVEVVARGRRVEVRAGDSWSSDGDWEAAVRGQATNPGSVAAAPLVPEGRSWEGSSSADGAVTEATRPRPRQRSTRDDDADKARFERAAALEPRSPKRAIVLYDRLAGRDGPWAGPALFASARLHAELGNARKARRKLERYLDKYPEGGNAADARALLATLKE